MTVRQYRTFHIVFYLFELAVAALVLKTAIVAKAVPIIVIGGFMVLGALIGVVLIIIGTDRTTSGR